MTEQYQDFGDGGDSNSSEKLSKLLLPSDMTGIRVLDIGCNAGFFCIEAAKRGATCIGVEMNERWFNDAIKNADEAGLSDRCKFIHGGWADVIPTLEGKFDYILWMSAIHYEKNQRSVIEKVAKKINPTGVLILECGMIEFLGSGPVVQRVTRGDGYSVPHFTLEYLRNYLLEGLFIGKIQNRSVIQEGDPVTRWVVHCYPKRQSLRVIRGVSAIGKTNHAVELARATSSVLLRGDDFFFDLYANRKGEIPEKNFSELRKCFNAFNNDKKFFRVDHSIDHLIESGYAGSIAEMFIEMLSGDYDYVLEGYMPQPVMDALKSKLPAWVIWETTRSV